MPHAETAQAVKIVRMVLQAQDNQLSAVFTLVQKCFHLSRICIRAGINEEQTFCYKRNFEI
jgi:hypothetical protein